MTTLEDGLILDLKSVVRQLDLHQGRSDLAGIGIQVSQARKLVQEAVTLLSREKGKGSQLMDNQ